jgi:PIN domain nuclease of toxin-antitoxin system
VNVVLDASALLAWLQDEPGAELVDEVLGQAALCSVNWAEVLQKSTAHGVDVTGLRDDLEAIGLTIVSFDAQDAERTAGLWKAGAGLSLGHRACLALGIRHGLPVWTADRLWAEAATGAEVLVIRL